MKSRCMNGSGLRWGKAIAAMAVLSIPSVAVFAATGDQLEEVVVTATRREQNLQEVPIAVTAFTAEAMQSRGVTDIHSLSMLTPNVNLDAGAPFSGDSSVLSASIRGIGQDDFAFNLDPGVGVYVDGAYLARTIGANQNLLDVDRIEILKGPQGTLFGRNTIGGAINVVTHTPGKEFAVSGMLTEGQRNRHDILFTADIPISSSVLSSISVSSQHQDGYQTLIPFPATAPYQVLGQADYPKASGNGELLDPRWQEFRDDPWQVALACLRHLRRDLVGRLHPSEPIGHPQHDPGGLRAQQRNLTCREFGQRRSAVYGPNIIRRPLQCLHHDLGGGSEPGPLSLAGRSTPPTVCADRWPSVPGIRRRTSTGNGLGYPGAPALGGNGAVNVPLSVLASAAGQLPPYVHIAPGASVGSLLFPGQTPRIYWDFANTQTGNIDTTYSNGPSFAKNDAYGGSLTLDWKLGRSMHLKSITGWRQITWNIGTDLDGLPESMQEVTDGQGQRQVSEELQLNGKAMDDKLNYTAGLYYFKESGYVHDFVPFDTGYLYVYDYDNNVKTDSYAGYLHLDYKLTDAWGLTAGVRYSHEKKQFLGGQADLNGFTYKISGCLDPNANANTFRRLRRGAQWRNLPAGTGFPGARQAAALFSQRLG